MPTVYNQSNTYEHESYHWNLTKLYDNSSRLMIFFLADSSLSKTVPKTSCLMAAEKSQEVFCHSLQIYNPTSN
ncbi:hypothetical protein RCL_jg10431.t1 [Rhizophagus clarus]|uniref:Uncharacterized protein n=1 Tax=Rhizophagus clarus TaxID=94130 RepID=A0A8H3KS43_9GLOM|nr:hypothetical protein RCL_jg10431.t1 [Rhizophagus clarus]